LVFITLVVCATVVASAKDPRGVESTHSIQVGAGWNLMSLPASVSNGSSASLFPTSTSPAFVVHDSGGYEPQDTLWYGIGFW